MFSMCMCGEGSGVGREREEHLLLFRVWFFVRQKLQKGINSYRQEFAPPGANSFL